MTMKQIIYTVFAVVFIFATSIQASDLGKADLVKAEFNQNEIAITPSKHLKKLTYILMDPKFNMKDYSPMLDDKLLTFFAKLQSINSELQSRQDRDIKSLINKLKSAFKKLLNKIKKLTNKA